MHTPCLISKILISTLFTDAGGLLQNGDIEVGLHIKRIV